jgi:hypothetical protein
MILKSQWLPRVEHAALIVLLAFATATAQRQCDLGGYLESFPSQSDESSCQACVSLTHYG